MRTSVRLRRARLASRLSVADWGSWDVGLVVPTKGDPWSGASKDSANVPPSVCRSLSESANAAGTTKKQQPQAITTSSSAFRHLSPRAAKTTIDTRGPAAFPKTLSADLRAYADQFGPISQEITLPDRVVNVIVSATWLLAPAPWPCLEPSHALKRLGRPTGPRA